MGQPTRLFKDGDTQTLTKSEESCDLCGAAMIDFNCELICTNCGYRRDCSDP